MPRGGARPGAGRKPSKSLAEKLESGNPGGRPLKRVEFSGCEGDSNVNYMAPDFMRLMDAAVPGIPTPTVIFEETVEYLRPSGCLHLIPVLLLGDYVLAKYQLLIAQYQLAKTGILTQDEGKTEIYITPFTEAMLKLQKNALATWAPIWDIVSKNSLTRIDDPDAALFGMIMGARKRKNQVEGETGYETAASPYCSCD
jgi:hypothetical protein